MKVDGKTILSKTCLASEPKTEKITTAKTLEEILSENISQFVLIYDKETGKFVGDGNRCLECFEKWKKDILMLI